MKFCLCPFFWEMGVFLFYNNVDKKSCDLLKLRNIDSKP